MPNSKSYWRNGTQYWITIFNNTSKNKIYQNVTPQKKINLKGFRPYNYILIVEIVILKRTTKKD